MKEIPLTQGQVAIVDDQDFDYLMQWKWFARFGRKTWYAHRSIRHPKRGIIIMHRVIMERDGRSAKEVDHINSNGLDNRRENLRPATRSQNMSNRGFPTNNTSGIKGVSWDKQRQKWRSYVRCGYRQISLGRWGDIEDATAAYNIAALILFGRYAKVNPL